MHTDGQRKNSGKEDHNFNGHQKFLNLGVFCGPVQVWDMPRSLQDFYRGGRIGGFKDFP